jgi:hypothetical protein
VVDLLEMVMTQESEAQIQQRENDVIEILRHVTGLLYRDADVIMVDAAELFAELAKFGIDAQSDIYQKLKRIERSQKIPRTKLDELIDSLEDVPRAYVATHKQKRRQRGRRRCASDRRFQTELRCRQA